MVFSSKQEPYYLPHQKVSERLPIVNLPPTVALSFSDQSLLVSLEGKSDQPVTCCLSLPPFHFPHPILLWGPNPHVSEPFYMLGKCHGHSSYSFELGSGCVNQTDPTVVLPLLPRCYHHRYEPWPASTSSGDRAVCHPPLTETWTNMPTSPKLQPEH